MCVCVTDHQLEETDSTEGAEPPRQRQASELSEAAQHIHVSLGYRCINWCVVLDVFPDMSVEGRSYGQGKRTKTKTADSAESSLRNSRIITSQYTYRYEGYVI